MDSLHAVDGLERAGLPNLERAEEHAIEPSGQLSQAAHIIGGKVRLESDGYHATPEKG